MRSQSLIIVAEGENDNLPLAVLPTRQRRNATLSVRAEQRDGSLLMREVLIIGIVSDGIDVTKARNPELGSGGFMISPPLLDALPSGDSELQPAGGTPTSHPDQRLDRENDSETPLQEEYRYTAIAKSRN